MFFRVLFLLYIFLFLYKNVFFTSAILEQNSLHIFTQKRVMSQPLCPPIGWNSHYGWVFCFKFKPEGADCVSRPDQVWPLTLVFTVWRNICVRVKVDLFSTSGPAAVQNLTAVLVNTTSLSFSWRPSDGHVDTYDLSLYSISEATSNHRAAGSGKEHQQVWPCSGSVETFRPIRISAAMMMFCV